MYLHINSLKLQIATAFLILLASVIWHTLRRSQRKDPDEAERLRRMDLNRRGRIVAAEIVDLLEPASSVAARDARRPLVVVYKYEVAGVTYEVSQDVSALPSALGPGCSPSSPISSVKYDPKAPTNSIIVCEEWSGI